jgi:hypothetical protein
MKTSDFKAALLGALIAGVLSTGCGKQEQKANQEKLAKLEKHAVEIETALVAAQAEVETQKQAAAQWQEKFDQAVKSAAASSEHLSEATAKIKQLEAANEKRMADAQTAAEVPPPIVKNGLYTFPKLVSSKMETLGENMEFSSRFGRSLIFKAEDGKRPKFDVDQLHSVILAALNIDPDAAKADQAKIDAGNKAFAETSAKTTAAYNATMAEASGAAAKEAADQAALQAKLDQQNRQAMANQQQQQPVQPAAPAKMGKRRAYGN